jgi:hypothetical protein
MPTKKSTKMKKGHKLAAGKKLDAVKALKKGPTVPYLNYNMSEVTVSKIEPAG